MLSVAVEDYLKTIYKLQGEGTVSKSSSAQSLGVSQASVTNMVKRLARLQMVEHQRYKGVSLTPAGKKIALEIVRHHRLLETYLREVLGYSWAQMHEEAEQLEHHISEEFEQRIDKLLGFPTRDPHGHPIPNAELVIDQEVTVPLPAATLGKALQVHCVADTNTELLDYLDSIGLMPDVEVTVCAKAPFDGPLTITLNGKNQVIGHYAASHVFVLADDL